MLKNLSKIAYRSLIRDAGYSMINVAGLAIGMTSSILIMLWVWDETSYDRFHPNADRLYQVLINAKMDEKTTGTWHDMPYPVYQELKSNHSRIKTVTATDRGAAHLLTVGNTQMYKDGLYVTPEFLDVFQFKLLYGSAKNILNDPTAVVLTMTTAKALFGRADVVDKVIRIDNQSDVKVMGVIEDIPRQSSIQFDFLATISLYQSLNNWMKECNNRWDCYGISVYTELNPDVDVNSVNDEIRGIYENEEGLQMQVTDVFLYPVIRKRLHDEFENGKEASSDRSDYVTSFSWLAAGIILIACINFMNLATARSERRAREVGIRKIVGSGRRQLIYQFMGESVALSVLGFVIALLLVFLSLPLYNGLVNKQLSIPLSSPFFWLLSLGLVLVTGVFAGSYPAFYLSSFNPAKVLKGMAHIGRDAILPRKVLVGFQFAFSLSLIVGALVVYQQTEFVLSRQTGFDKENLITMESNPELINNYKTVKDELIRSGLAVQVTQSNSPITQIDEINFLDWPGNPGEAIYATNIYSDFDYAKTMGIKILEGRDFSEPIPGDSSAVIINEAAVKQMNLEKPIGSKISVGGEPYTVIGITEDVIMGNPSDKVDPMYMVLQTSWPPLSNNPNLTIRLSPTSDVSAAMKKVELLFNKFNPSNPFQYSFVDVEYDKNFNRFYLMGRLSNLFAILAILIAFLGLLGLASFTAERRTKEFGVRKVLGASVLSLVRLISTDFIRLILVAFVVSIPISVWALNNFLESYTYRISLDWKLFPITGLLVLVLSLIIVSVQAIRAATANPVETLRSE